MNHLLLFLFTAFSALSYAQLNQKLVEKKEGAYMYCYHKNGKISTEEFRNTASDYMAQGYAKAFDKSGNEIYNQPTSRSGLLSSVHFSYYESGAVKSAEYNAHPDAGIQWYRKITYFDEDGKITSEQEMSDDMWKTIIAPPDTAYYRAETERRKREAEVLKEKQRLEREQYARDSSAFFIAKTEVLEDGSILEYIPNPGDGSRQLVIKKAGRVTQITTEYYLKGAGVQSIRRTYFKNGRVYEEFIYEAQLWHYRKYDKKGMLVEEILNQSIAHSK